MSTSSSHLATLKSKSALLWPGVLLCGLAAIAAQFLSIHYGAPAMLLALLLGLALQSATVGAERLAEGIAFSSSTMLRLGVGLLGARVSLDAIMVLGLEAVWLVVTSIVVITILSFCLAWLLGRGWRLAVLTGGAVSICGASAAIAIASILPRNEHSDRNLSFTVFSVTLLSTVAMVAYPIIGQALGLSNKELALFLGGTIHDVAQVVGAGFSISDDVGESSTTVKLLRVSMLAPFVMLLSVSLAFSGIDAGEKESGTKPALLPWFVVMFAIMVMLSGFGIIPDFMQHWLWQTSSWFLLIAIVGVGLKTDLKGLLEMPPRAAILIVLQTLLLAGFVLIWILLTRE
ncbi:MAG: putative sulfate exporter family transporter [Pseudomonadota bacterium]